MVMNAIDRLLKHLAAMGSVYETGADSYLSTPVSKAYIQPVYRDAVPFWFVHAHRYFVLYPG